MSKPLELTFVASGLDINGCVLNYFEGTAVIQAVHSLLNIVAKCHLFSVIKYLHKCEGCTHFCEILYIYTHTHTHTQTDSLSLCGLLTVFF